MLTSKNLLQSYFDKPLPSADVIAEKITAHSFEIEGMEKKGKDTLIDVKVLPNRAHDCLSHRGIAKEISAILEIPMRKQVVSKLPKANVKAPKIDIVLKDKRCLRYSALVLDNIEVGPSPKWLKDAINSLGARSINNVVDATNYVLYMIGQPLHAFDYAKLSGSKIVIRESKAGEKILTLDGKDIDLEEGTLIIADNESPLAVAGVKGGVKAEIDKNTKTIVLESANFDGGAVRKAAQKYNLKTDAAKRFEQGMTPHLVDEAMIMVANIIIDTAGGKNVFAGELIVKGAELPKQRFIKISLRDIVKIIGAPYTAKEVTSIWKRLGFKHEIIGKDIDTSWVVEIPHERIDITIKEDLTEEVCRLVGLFDLKGTLPLEPLVAPKKNVFWDLRDKAREVMLSNGYSEIYTYSFNNIGEVELKNPLSGDKKTLRNNLSHGLRTALAENLKYRESVKIFEFGSIFGKNNGVISERRSFAAVIGFQKRKQAQVKEDFIAIKGSLDSIAKACGLPAFRYVEGGGEIAAQVYIEKTLIGILGVQGFELDFDLIAEISAKQKRIRYVAPSKYPSMIRDVALWVPLDVRAGDIDTIIRNNMGKLATDLKLFDVFEKPEENKKSFAFRITLQGDDHTLSDDEANEVANNVVSKLREADSRFDVRS
jgi:phenylalanyl-tRNA synthetase beta chain